MNELWIPLGNFYSDKPIGGKDRKEIIKEAKKRVFDYVWREMRAHGEIRPPFLAKPETSSFVRAQRVQKVIPSEIKGEGYLLPRDNGFVIIVRKDLAETRRRTVIAHELGHTFFFTKDGKPIHPYVGSTANRPNDAYTLWSNIEGPSFEIGRQILVPEQLLPRYKIASDVSMKNFNKLKKQFNVSTDVMARRLIHDVDLWSDVYFFVTNYGDDGIKLPKNSSRFVGNHFKRGKFSLNRNWDIIVKVLDDSIINADSIHSKRVKMDKCVYNIESYCQSKSSIISCLIRTI